MQVRKRLVTFLLPTAALAFAVPNVVQAQSETSFAEMQRNSDRSVIEGTSSLLVRTDDGVAMTINTRELQRRGAYTNWWITFNDPEECSTPCECTGDDLGTPAVNGGVFWATGRVADRFGQAEFAANTDFGERPDGEGQIPNPDLDNPVAEGAEIHLVVRSHGRALGRFLEEQLTTINGGCPPNECVDVQFAIHRSPTCVAP